MAHVSPLFFVVPMAPATRQNGILSIVALSACMLVLLFMAQMKRDFTNQINELQQQQRTATESTVSKLREHFQIVVQRQQATNDMILQQVCSGCAFVCWMGEGELYWDVE